MEGQQRRIALVVSNGAEFYARPILQGVAQALLPEGRKLLTLVGEEYSQHGRERNAVFQLLASPLVEGAIVLGGSMFHERGAAAHFRSKYPRLPLVCVGSDMPDASIVLADNATGVCAAVRHLATLGRRRIAFIRGPRANVDANERYRGYCLGLAKVGLERDPELIAPGAFVPVSGEKAVELLIDERGTRPDAIIAANDLTARGALVALQRRGVQVPGDIALIGFDDVPDAQLTVPQLTTVAQPLYELGLRAGQVLLSVLQGRQQAQQHVLPTRLVVRQSCGGDCGGDAAGPMLEMCTAEAYPEWIERSFEAIWAWVHSLCGWASVERPPLRRLLELALQPGDDPQGLRHHVKQWLSSLPLGEGHRCPLVLEQLAILLAGAVNEELAPQVSARVARAHELATIHAAADRARHLHSLEVDFKFAFRLARRLLETNDRELMLSEVGLALASHPRVTGYHVALFDDKRSWSRLALSSGQASVSLEHGVSFLSRSVLPKSALSAQEPASLAAVTLSNGERAHGTLFVETDAAESLRVVRVADHVAAWLNAHEADAQDDHLRGKNPDGSPVRVGAYRVKRRLGRGGMATVYLAEREGTGVQRPVALKLLHPHLQDAGWTEQLVEEARVTASIRHPNVVQLIELGEYAGGMFLVMEYVPGCNLAALLGRVWSRKEELPLRVVGRILLDGLAGLHAAHQLRDADGIPLHLVHRDISPQNLLIGTDGRTRVADFGIARTGGVVVNTHTGVTKGKLHYMSPEQAGGQPLDRRSDIWAMGVVAWEMVTGQRLYGEESEPCVLRRIIHSVPPPVASVRQLAGSVEAVIARALRSRPSERFGTAFEFRSAVVEAWEASAGIAGAEEVAELAVESERASLEESGIAGADEPRPPERRLVGATRA